MAKANYNDYSPENIHIVFAEDQPNFTFEDLNITASFALIRNEGKLLVINGKRGWDIPGGHVEDGETATDAVHREVLEEACVTIENVQPYAAMINGDTAMAAYTANIRELNDFAANKEDGMVERAFMEIDKFLSTYTGGDVGLMTRLLSRLGR